MDELALTALKPYNLTNPRLEFIRHNENMTYKVIDEEQCYVLRIHKHKSGADFSILGDDMYSFDSLSAEMQILCDINEKTDIQVQSPIQNIKGDYVSKTESGIPITLLSWRQGINLENIEITNDILYAIGEMIGKFHNFSKSYLKSKPLCRKKYDKDMLESWLPYYETGVKRGLYAKKHFDVILKTIKEIEIRMQDLNKQEGSFGIIHSDLSKSNLLWDDHKVIPIDFCLSGYGYYYHDLGSLFGHFQIPEQQEIIIKGYQNVVGEPVYRGYIETFEIYQIMMFLAANANSNPDISWFPESFF